MQWIGLIVLIMSSILLYMFVTARENNVLRHTLVASGIAERCRFYFISDVHARTINRRMIARIQHEVDFVIIGGDFADQRTPLARIEQNLQTLSLLGPIYFVWGNNDREVGESALLQLFAVYNVTVLNNTAVPLPYKNNIWLSAIDDTSSRYNIEAALQPCPEEANILFVSHNPKIFHRVRPHATPLLLMGGHLHGGQIRVGPYGMQPHGYFRNEDGIDTLVSNGYGTTLVPLRLGAKPQTHIVDITFSEQA